jgi:gamma-glutamyltranspeptidase / glutathione hydrolase
MPASLPSWLSSPLSAPGSTVLIRSSSEPLRFGDNNSSMMPSPVNVNRRRCAFLTIRSRSSKGNAISINLSDVCSDTIVIPGTGLAPSSRGSQSWADPKHPSSVAPGKRPRLTPNPVMAMRRGHVTMPIGSPGGDSQVQAVLQVLLNMTLFGMDPQTAIEQPRFITYSHPDSFAPHPSFPGLLCLEGRFPSSVAASLSALGHKINMWPDRLWRAGGCLSREGGP